MLDMKLVNVFGELGISTTEMVERIKQVADLINRMSYTENELAAVKDSLNDLYCRVDYQDDEIDKKVKVLDDKVSGLHATAMMEIDLLRPATDAKTENPKQKSDLEIFSWIVPSEEFLKLEGNMFLN